MNTSAQNAISAAPEMHAKSNVVALVNYKAA